MTKEYFEAFETVYNNIDYLISDVVIEDNEVSGCLMTIKEQILTIKQALINYTNITKQIEEADYKSAIGLLVKVKDNLDSYTYNTILEALQHLESIDNANPSEALECLEGIANQYDINYDRDDERYITIKQALIQTEQDKKKARCWDIVVKKNVDMLLIKKYENVSDYNSAVWLSGREKLTEEEFKTLKKEMLE